jgi:hypothetical protein
MVYVTFQEFIVAFTFYNNDNPQRNGGYFTLAESILWKNLLG